jgi:ABC-2 type transport system permease protein
MISSLSLKTFIALLRGDLYAFRAIIKDRLINFFIWGTTCITIAHYIMPYFGVPSSYGVSSAIGVFVSTGIFEGHGRVAELITEMSDDRPILYYITLPLPASWIVVRIMLSNAIRSAALSLLLFPLIKVLLGGALVLSAMHIGAFLGMVIAANLFYGACTVYLATKLYSVADIGNVWNRIVFPLWFFGGFQFTQQALLSAFPRAGYLNFINPIMYITEGMRGAVLGSSEFIDVRVCMAMLVLFIGIVGYAGIVQFKKRLDVL